MAGKIGPEYQRLIDRIRASIASGEYPLGQAIPSTAVLAERPGVRASGPPGGRPARGGRHPRRAPRQGRIREALPEDADRERQDVTSLSKQVSELEERVSELAERQAVSQDGDLGRIVADLQETVGRLEVNLIDLYGRIGHDYPQGGRAQDGKKTAVRRGQAR